MRNKISTIDVKPIDTTGAGDAFFAGALSVLDKNKKSDFTDVLLDDALKFGNVTGALNTLGRGAIDNLPDLKEINKYLSKY